MLSLYQNGLQTQKQTQKFYKKMIINIQQSLVGTSKEIMQ